MNNLVVLKKKGKTICIVNTVLMLLFLIIIAMPTARKQQVRDIVACSPNIVLPEESFKDCYRYRQAQWWKKPFMMYGYTH